LLAIVIPWLPGRNSGVTQVRGASLRMPPKKNKHTANLGARAQGPPKTPTVAAECTADEEHPPANMADDDEGGNLSSCSEDPDSDFEDGVTDPRQTTLTMHLSQRAFQTAQDPRANRGESFHAGFCLCSACPV